MALLRFNKSQRSKRGLEEITDATACKNWLASLSLGNNADILTSISDFLRETPQDELAPMVRLQILDQCRVVVYAALRERVEHEEFRALPMDSTEIEPVWAVIDAAAVLRDAYQTLTAQMVETAAHDSGRSGVRNQSLHRALDTHAHMLMLYLGTRVAVPLCDWEEHCRMGQQVRDFEAQDVDLADSLKASFTQTCREAFVAPLLLALAEPGSVTQVDYQILRACARRFSNKVGFRIDSAANPAARAAARPVVNPGPTLRVGEYQIRFDCQRLFTSLESRLAALDQGKTPSHIGFGSRTSVASSRVLLQRMMRMWGAVVVDAIESPEHNWRKPEHQQSLAILGMPATINTVSVRPSAVPVAGTYRYDKDRHDRLTSSPEEIEADRLLELFAQAENWQCIGELADTLLFSRRHPRPRASMNQLVVVKPGGKDGHTPMLLGYVQGLQQAIQEDAEGRIRPSSAHALRVKLLAGLPVRISASSEGTEFPNAFLMATGPVSATPNIANPALWSRVHAEPQAFSLILPLAGHKMQRPLRIVGGGAVLKVTCEGLLFRGLDFVQVGFSLV